jgi:hypothetical protein
MYKLFAIVLVLPTIAMATVRTPVTTIPGPGSSCFPVFAAQNGVLAFSCGTTSNFANTIQLYAIGTWNQIATLTISDQGAGVTSIAIQNNYILAGSFNSNTGSDGAVYVFVKPSSGWASESESAVLTPSDPEAGSYFGWSVAAWGSTVVVGSPGYSTNMGKAYVYIEPAKGWVDATENGQLTASDAKEGWGVGRSVAITGPVGSGGNQIVLGAPAASAKPGKGGWAYVFEEPTSGWPWTMMQTAEISDGNAGKEDGGDFGYSVSLAENGVLAVGEPFVDPGGDVRLYLKPANGWIDTTKPNFTLSEKTVGYLGMAVSLTQNGSVLTSCCVTASALPKELPDTAYLYHANQQWGPAIKLSAKGLASTGVVGSTSTLDWAFTVDGQGNVYVFDGK